MRYAKHVVIAIALTVMLAGAALAEQGTVYVGTVHGTNAFDVQDGGGRLYFHPQADTPYVWNENNGSEPGTLATSGSYYRDGMKTFAATDVAYGATLKDIKFQFDYNTGPDPMTGLTMSNPSINVFLTDGNGRYGIWSATSGGTAFTTTALVDGSGSPTGWKRVTLDCATVDDNLSAAIYEHNGFSVDYIEPYTRVAWSEIKNFTVAGFYDYQRTPEGGFEAWNETLWSDITNVADPGDTTLNRYGITINWGDTVGAMAVDDQDGIIGQDATRAYGQAGRMIENYQVTVGTTTYDMTFEAGVPVSQTPVPLPPSAFMLLTGIVGVGGVGVWRRRRR